MSRAREQYLGKVIEKKEDSSMVSITCIRSCKTNEPTVFLCHSKIIVIVCQIFIRDKVDRLNKTSAVYEHDGCITKIQYYLT